MSVIYTGGSFDLLHSGHINLLRECWREADGGGGEARVVVGLNTDAFIEQYKGEPPVMSYDERRAVLLACKYVDEVVENMGGGDSTQAIKLVKPHKIVVGSDWRDKDYYAQMGFSPDWLPKQECRLVYVPYTPNISTTDIKARLK